MINKMSIEQHEYSRLAFQSSKVLNDHGLAASHVERRSHFMRRHAEPILLDLQGAGEGTTEVQALRLAEKVAKAVHRASDDALRASAHHFADAMCREARCAQRGPQWDEYVASFLANADKEGARDELFSHVVGHQLREEEVRPMRMAMRWSFKGMMKGIGKGLKKAASAVGTAAKAVGKGVVGTVKFVVKNAPLIAKTITSGVACVGSLGASVGSCVKTVTGLGQTVFKALEAGKVKLPKWAQTVKKGVDVAATVATFIPGLRLACDGQPMYLEDEQQQQYYAAPMRFDAQAAYCAEEEYAPARFAAEDSGCGCEH